MNTTSDLPTNYAELPSEARALLFIFANAAAASYVSRPPKRSELAPMLESIWNRHRLCLGDLSDPSRMTALLETELSSLRSAGGTK